MYVKAIWSWFRAREWDGASVEPSLGKPAATTTLPDWTGPATVSPPGAWAVNEIPKWLLKHERGDWEKFVESDIFSSIKWSPVKSLPHLLNKWILKGWTNFCFLDVSVLPSAWWSSLKVQCVVCRIEGICGREWNIIFSIMFPFFEMLCLHYVRIIAFYLKREPAFPLSLPCYCHFSTVAQIRQMKYWLWRLLQISFAFLFFTLFAYLRFKQPA